jgi:hypothetical protein
LNFLSLFLLVIKQGEPGHFAPSITATPCDQDGDFSLRKDVTAPVPRVQAMLSSNFVEVTEMGSLLLATTPPLAKQKCHSSASDTIKWLVSPSLWSPLLLVCRAVLLDNDASPQDLEASSGSEHHSR